MVATRKGRPAEAVAPQDDIRNDAGSETPRLELQGVAKAYQEVNAVRYIDLSVRQGEFLTILGPSGSGKTTVLRIVAGFTTPSSGKVLIDGRDVVKLPPADRGLGIVLQHYSLFPHMTVAQNIEYGLRMRGWSKQRRAEQVTKMTELVGLEGMERRLPRELSGGQQQRVAVARALAFGPMLLLMDEPLGALDRELRIRMAGELRRIHRELGTTVVYVTHDREEALTLSDRVAIMHHGLMEDIDSPAGLYRRPRSSFVARFFGGHNLLPARVRAVDAQADEGERVVEAECLGHVVQAKTWCDVEVGESAHLAVAARAAAVGGNPDPADLCLPGRVTDVVYLGELVQVSCELDDGTTVQAAIPVDSGSGVSVGKTVTVRIDQERLVLVR